MENEHSLLENDKHNDCHLPIALAACDKPAKLSTGVICGNPVCKKTGHTIDFVSNQVVELLAN
jgi:hypothetical protein